YLGYAYTKQGSPVTLRMPLDPGSYELRFVQSGKKVLARQPIAVTPATATLSAPDSAAAGSIVEVEFTGPPPGSGDYVAVSPRGSKDPEYAHYAYTKL